MGLRNLFKSKAKRHREKLLKDYEEGRYLRYSTKKNPVNNKDKMYKKEKTLKREKKISKPKKKTLKKKNKIIKKRKK